MTINEIYTAINWLFENRRNKLLQWAINTFGCDSLIHIQLTTARFADAAREIAEYDLCVQLELVELMYN